MNREEILAMPASRELDALVAENVMGWTRHKKKPTRTDNRAINGVLYCPPGCHGTDFGGSLNWVNQYSYDLQDAWLVVEKMKPLMVRIESSPTGFTAVFFDKHSYEGEVSLRGELMPPEGEAPTAPLAICRAALLSTPNNQQKGGM